MVKSNIAERWQSRRQAWDKRMVLMTLSLLLATLIGVLGDRSVRASSPPTSLLPELHGARTSSGKVIFDEADGRFGGVALGTSVSAARTQMPAQNLVGSMVPGQDLIYCSRPTSAGCTKGIVVNIVGYCEIWFAATCAPGNIAGPVSEISLVAVTNPLLNPESQDAVTLRGIGLGSSANSVGHAYRITETGTVTCGSVDEPPPGASYISVVGKNTIEFTTHLRVVWAITLWAGRHPRLCTQQG
jgi:hypothetical protein